MRINLDDVAALLPGASEAGRVHFGSYLAAATQSASKREAVTMR